jgi:hypothetical protein
MRIKLELDERTTSRLVEIALAEKRPVAWQLEILVQQAIAQWHTPVLRTDLSGLNTALEAEPVGMRDGPDGS